MARSLSAHGPEENMKKVFLLVLLAGSLVSCSRSSPSGTVTVFMEAGKAGNKDALMQCLESKDREFLKKMEAKQPAGREFGPPKGASYRIGEEKIDGETATVTVVTIEGGQEKPRELKLVRESGQWKIDLVPDGMLQMVEGMMKGMDEGAMKGMGEAMQGFGEKLKAAAEEAEK
jgi:hypothetical protein